MASDATTAERDRIVAALKRCGYVMSRTADDLGIASSTLTRWVARHGLRDLIAEHNPESAGRRFPRSPHESSRQADHQRANRERGLCGCGGEPEPRPDGGVYKACAKCRSRDADRKKRAPRRSRRKPLDG